MKLKSLVALGAMLLLAGCPDLTLPGLSGSSSDPKALAVTKVDARGITSATVGLSWQGVSGASNYQVGCKIGDGPEAVVGTTEKTSYEDRVNPKMTLTYYVHALNVAGEELKVTAGKTVVVMDAQVGKPAALAVDGTEASGSVPNAKSSKPTFSWSTASGANAYYVTVNEMKDGGLVGKLVYASLTKSPTATVGVLSQADLNLPGYTQVKGDGLIKGKNYYFAVTAIRTDVADLAAATGFDVAGNEGRAAFTFI